MRPPAPRAGLLGRLFAWLGGAFFAVSLLYFLYVYFVRFGRIAATGSAAEALAVNAGLFAVFALHHSALARSGARRLVERLTGPELERAAYVWIASALFLFCCAAWRDVPGVVYRLPSVLHPAGWLVQAAGLGMTVAASRRLDALELAGIRQAIGGRRDVPLQTEGLYGLVRHPVYLAWVLLVFGAPQMTATRFSFACLSTAYLVIAIPFEERSLRRLYGDAYREYQRHVRWRMIPGLY
ncbi:MAG TPA: isoprenylcysteine carboxylmethyltransferase family protein [Vicinamibacterales bacterium]|nr:isoprenylcysteine carboxylmethyltransferase family protein [Vicinamibacterales bacterium]